MVVPLGKSAIWYENKGASGHKAGTPLNVNGATVRSRTADLRITSASLYQLSYGGQFGEQLLYLWLKIKRKHRSKS